MTNLEVQAMEAIKGIRNELAKANSWETRRYEIAKDLLVKGGISPEWAIASADKMVELLRKNE